MMAHFLSRTKSTQQTSRGNGCTASLHGDSPRRRVPSAHLEVNYWISARPLPVIRTSSPMTVMFSSRPTIRLVLESS